MRPVSDVMSPDLISIGPDETVGEVRAKLRVNGVNCVPVIHDGLPVGIVSSWDFTEDIADDASVTQIMTKDVKKIGQDDTTDEAARRMVEEFVHHLLVVDSSGEVLGVISSFDLLLDMADLSEPAE